MKKLLLSLALASLTVAFAPAQEGPTPQSQEEVDALMAIQNAPDPGSRIEAAQTLLKDFKDTEFKSWANVQMMMSAREMGDYEQIILFGQETLRHDPGEVSALLTMSEVIPMRTQEFDLDKEEKLNQAEDYAKQALKVIPMKANPNPEQIPEEQWLMAKKDFMAGAHKSLGLIESRRGNSDAAIGHYKESLEVASQQDPSVFYFMAETYHKAGNKAEALNAINQSIAGGGLPMGDGSNAADSLKAKIEAMP
jgi:tetratricopeptide (TPR) repeat protein